MATYNESGLTYDEIDLLYDGLELRDDITLIVNGQDVTDSLEDRGLSVSVNNHGNSLGTLDATLIDPAVIPSLDDEARLYIGTDSRYLGAVKSLDIDEYRGGHLWVSFGCQDSGPDEGAIPTAAPFDISDDPDDVATFGYERLSKKVQNTDGGTTKTTYEMVVGRDGLWIDQNVEVTAANYSLSAEELTIKKVSVRWRTPDSPEYALELGDPTVSMAQVIAEAGFIPDDSITATKISDGAIQTPHLAAGAITTEKLDADAVIANVANVGDTVVIDSTGIDITDGAITVENGDSVVIIDGTSNMFKILASGTVSDTCANGTGSVEFNDLSGLGTWETIPIAITAGSFSNDLNTNRQLGREVTFASQYVASSSGGSPTNLVQAIEAEASCGSVVRSATSYASIVLGIGNYSGASVTAYFRYHLCREEAF